MYTENYITQYFHCGKCLEEIPEDISPREFARLEIGWTEKGLQVRCTRHDLNVINLDFKGEKVSYV